MRGAMFALALILAGIGTAAAAQVPVTDRYSCRVERPGLRTPPGRVDFMIGVDAEGREAFVVDTMVLKRGKALAARVRRDDAAELRASWTIPRFRFSDGAVSDIDFSVVIRKPDLRFALRAVARRHATDERFSGRCVLRKPG